MSINVYLVRSSEVLETDIHDIVQFFEKTPGPISVYPTNKILRLKTNSEGDIEWNPTFIQIRNVREKLQLSDVDIVCLLTDLPNTHNYFAVSETSSAKPLFEQPSPRNFFVHINQKDYVTHVSRTIVTIHWILKKVMDCLIDTHFQLKNVLWHRHSIGCLFDFCEEKKDVQFKIHSAQICGDCLDHCEKLENSQELLSQVIECLENCRILSIPTQRYVKNKYQKFTEWPFPIAITRHLYERSSRPIIRLYRLLDHFENLIRFTVITESLWNGMSLNIPRAQTLGQWVGLLRNLQSQINIHNIQQALEITEKDKMIHFRNSYRGHGMIFVNEEEYGSLLTEFEQSVFAVERTLHYLLYNRKLVIFSSVQVDLTNATYIAQGELLEGSNYIFPNWNFSTKENILSLISIQQNFHPMEIEQSQIFITDKAHTRFESAKHYIRRTLCPSCKHMHILIFDGEYYIDLQEGHRTLLHPNT